MKEKPVLIIMAAGMGSRYGGLKQMDPLGPNGEKIIDFSLYDAKKAGFEKAICVIKHSIEEDFKAMMEAGAAKCMEIEYAFQELSDIPGGISIPEGREKPWGTGQAILSTRNMVNGPFAVINADDYYGPEAFKVIYDYLESAEDGEKYNYCMVAYKVENTLTDNGQVSRGICEISEDGILTSITERTNVACVRNEIFFIENNRKGLVSRGTPVSMNLFGFTKSFMAELERQFPEKLKEIIAENPLKGEYQLPIAVSSLIKAGKAEVKALSCGEKWYGVTYMADKDSVKAALKAKKDEGLYPENLWE